ncbi:MAG: hypothetical protein U1E62_21425 [Alsobacter sp.]
MFFVNTRFFRYGTKDQGHAAAIVLSAFLLLIVLILGIGSLIAGRDLQLVSLVMNAFTLIAGVAIGKSIGKPKQEEQ